MIYTVTMSPSLDLVIQLASPLQVGQTQRAIKEELRPGGKGINISIMLHNLGVMSTAFGFVAGFSGDELMRMTAATGVKTGFLRVRRGRTRINIRIKDGTPAEQSAMQDGTVKWAHGVQTSINGLGPEVAPDDIQYLMRKLAALTAEDYLVLAGMVPPSLPQDIYSKVFTCFKPSAAPKVIVDAPADQFKYVLKYHPFLIKPNLRELSDYLKLELKDAPSVLEACHRLQCEGARNILVSLGAHGAIFVDERCTSLRVSAPGGPLVDKTGAGDSMIAGFLADYHKNKSLESAVYMAVATGSATATSEGIATREQVEKLRAQMSDHADWGEALI
ncbi:MAG: 1-phosphofructokinase family hexose kinase [Candidatus Anaerobiospirillum pullicola]|uniref:Phosphofructokinase n=1 Tax=Candidatus Anaerobiospirillum pullicola TaxID=2838451 RepID=A0A948X1M8_9GAMM|nr:1-phosphofructokinase family hexose kinase [Candidatus Anaerobiospirillum pullicola]